MLASILDIPPWQKGLTEYSFNHFQDHLEIVEGLKKVKNVVAPLYVIDPMTLDDMSGWLLRHSQFHNDMNASLGLEGSDLQTVNFKNERDRNIWLWQNFREHLAARTALGI